MGRARNGKGDVWKALADPHRRKILDTLRKGPKTTGQLCKSFKFSRFAVMKHLTVLVNAGLVLVEREGRERWNHINAVPIQQIYRRWIKPFEIEPADHLVRLKRHVESNKEK
jgi:DNA-binding transcriptional ArsR family regulator